MKIGIIDADLLGRKKHRFPNLACMKISGYYKEKDNSVSLITNISDLDIYDKIFVSKVFSDTILAPPIGDLLGTDSRFSHGGTGFFYDKATSLPYDIEHHMPDYTLYNSYIQSIPGLSKLSTKYYTDYSIGFITRGCFRKCNFCVNKHYDRVKEHSPLSEFISNDRKKICLLDDNFFGYPGWKNLLLQLQQTRKPFQFKQGLDIRLLDDQKASILFSSKYDGDYIFAFDDIENYDLIESKLRLLRKYSNCIPKFYCLCGFDKMNVYNEKFYKQDILDLFRRIELLMKYRCIPYVMRYEKFKEAPEYIRGIYIDVARWCNQPSFFKKQSFLEFVDLNCKYNKSTQRHYELFINEYSDFSRKYLEQKFND